MSEVVDRSLERVRRRRNDIEFDVARHPVAGLRRRRRPVARGAQPARQRREVEPAGRAGRCPADADRPVACRTGGVRPRARAFRRRSAGWCSSGSTARRRRGRCPVRGWAWRSSNRLCSNTAARFGSRTPCPAASRRARRSTWCCPGRPLSGDTHRRHGRAGCQRRQWLIGARSWGRKVWGCRRMFSKWILSPHGHREVATVVVPDVGHLLAGRAPQRHDEPPEVLAAATAAGSPARRHERTRRPDTPVRTRPAAPTQQQPYDWRYATQQQQQPTARRYDPYRGAPPADQAMPASRPLRPESVPAQVL